MLSRTLLALACFAVSTAPLCADFLGIGEFLGNLAPQGDVRRSPYPGGDTGGAEATSSTTSTSAGTPGRFHCVATSETVVEGLKLRLSRIDLRYDATGQLLFVEVLPAASSTSRIVSVRIKARGPVATNGDSPYPIHGIETRASGKGFAGFALLEADDTLQVRAEVLTAGDSDPTVLKAEVAAPDCGH